MGNRVEPTLENYQKMNEEFIIHVVPFNKFLSENRNLINAILVTNYRPGNLSVDVIGRDDGGLLKELNARVQPVNDFIHKFRPFIAGIYISLDINDFGIFLNERGDTTLDFH